MTIDKKKYLFLYVSATKQPLSVIRQFVFNFYSFFANVKVRVYQQGPRQDIFKGATNRSLVMVHVSLHAYCSHFFAFLLHCSPILMTQRKIFYFTVILMRLKLSLLLRFLNLVEIH